MFRIAIHDGQIMVIEKIFQVSEKSYYESGKIGILEKSQPGKIEII